ncbi:MAG: hypothetical protein Q4F05_01750 [bacterium]|nr:hypothetical protein [bacterium]
MDTILDMDVLQLKLEVSRNNFKKLVQKIYDKEMQEESKEAVLSLLLNGKEEFTSLMEEAHSFPTVTDELKDVQFAIFDHLLLANDLYTFYKEDLFDRFRLRFENYNQRQRVNSLL